LERGGGNRGAPEEDFQADLAMSVASEQTYKTNNLRSSGNGTISAATSAFAKPSSKLVSNSIHTVKESNSWDEEGDWDEEEDPLPAPTISTPVPKSAPAPPVIPFQKKSPPMAPKSTPFTVEEMLKEQSKNSFAPAITSLSQPKPSAKPQPRAPAKKQKEEDDYFASMGLSSIPTKAPAPVRKAPAAPATATASSWKNESFAASASMDTNDAGSDWDDDGDLDDLLDE